MPHAHLAGSSISGDVTPVSLASEQDFNSNEATAGSITDHDLMSAGEDDEETLSMEPGSSPVKLIKNDLSPQTYAALPRPDACQPSTSTEVLDFYGLNMQQTKDTFYKDMPSSSKNFNIESEITNKCTKEEPSQYLNNFEMLNAQNKISGSINKSKKSNKLNNESRRFSDGSAQKSSVSSQGNVSGSRFTTTLVTEDLLRPSTSSDNCEHH